MPDASTLGKWILVVGLGLVVLGGLVWVVGRLGLPVGRLPGDVAIQRGNFSVYFPCATSVIVSLLLTLVLNVIIRLFNR